MMKKPALIARDAAPYLTILAVFTAVFFYLKPVFALVPGILLLFVAFFFRNPPRVIPSDPGILVSPADGTVMEISEIYEDRFLNSRAVKVSIFLSLFNVHFNRSPLDGVIKYRSYRPGRMVLAFKSQALAVNEKNFVGIENEGLRVMVTQITGFIARRIVCWVKVGDKLSRGDLFGLLKFGSCTELIVPLTVEILVKTGAKVTGGETIIGRLKDEF